MRKLSIRLFLGFLIAAGPALEAGEPSRLQDRSVLVGLSLTEALLTLQDRGLRIAFTSQVVRPEMRVHSEPAGDTLTEVLDELLRPHGLKAEAHEEGLFVVLPGPPAVTGFEGVARIRPSHQPLGGVRILVPSADIEKVTDENGRFAVSDMRPGRYTIEAHLPGFVVERRADVEIESGLVRQISFDLEPAPVPLDEIVVTPSQVSLLRSDPVASLSFSRDEILALPHLGDDLFRALTLLPGTTGAEVSAEIHVRGGRSDEVLILFDNLEVYEPYHVKDFSNLLSIFAPQAIAEVDLILGGFPAQYGDRMGGVLQMNTVRPDAGKSRLGASIYTAQAGNSGYYPEGRGSWLAVARYGSFELVRDYLDEEEKPRFWDVFGKTTHQLNPSHQVSFQVLHADDELAFDIPSDEEGDSAAAMNNYGNSYAWINHQGLLSSKLFVNSGIYVGQVRRDRFTEEAEVEGDGFFVRDRRRLDVYGLKQDWTLTAAAQDERSPFGHFLQWGFDMRSLETEYDYVNERELEDPLGGDIRFNPRTGMTVFQEVLEGEQYSVYASDRVRLAAPLTLEMGLRYDEQTITKDRDLSPRVNLVYAFNAASTLRAAWGHYFQSQRVYELQVEDGDTQFSSAERTEAFLLGFEYVFRGGTTLRVNAYDRDIRNPRRRYENVFEPISKFPEVEPDRALIAPARSTSRGIELFVRGSAGPRLDWWVGYAYARVKDEIDGRDVPRGIDQPHTFNVDFSWRATANWTVNVAWRYHTGWPTTAIGAEIEEGDEGELEVVPVFGPFNAERLPDYHRLDLRASRQWQFKRGSLTFFVELQNLYDRANQAGIDVDLEFELLPNGEIMAVPETEAWGGFLPSFGIDWEF